jgi:hypothetical protein
MQRPSPQLQRRVFVVDPAPGSGTQDAEPHRMTRRLRPDWAALGGLGLLAVFLLPAIHASLRGDDGWNSEQHGLLALTGQSFLGRLADSSWSGLVDAGRPQVLGGIQGEVTIWLLEDHPALYRGTLIGLTVAAAGLLYALVRRFGLGRAGGLLVLAALAGAIQFRQSHDPMLGYYGTTQVVLFLLLASLLVFHRFLERGDRRSFLLAIALFAPCPLLYESAYTLAGAHLGLALVERRGREALRASAPFLVIAAGFFVLSFVLRKTSAGVTNGYQAAFNPFAILRTYVVQLFPPVPTSSVTLDPLVISAQPTKPELVGGIWRGAAVFALVVGSLGWLVRSGVSGLPARTTVRRLLVLGASLWLCAPMMIAPAPKYQATMTPGRGYLPVLIQVFGYAGVAAGTLVAALRAAAGRSRTAQRVTILGAAGLLGFAAGVVGYSNLRVVAVEQPARHTRDLLEHATSDGLFATMPERSTLLFGFRDMNWPGAWRFGESPLESMLLNRGGRRFDGRIVLPAVPPACPRTGHFPPADCEPFGPSTAWVHVRAHRGGGEVIIASMRARSYETAQSAPARSLRLYVAEDSMNAPRVPRLLGQAATGTRWASDRLPWRRAAAGEHWAIYEAAVPAAKPPRAASLDDDRGDAVDFTNPPPPPELARRFGTQQLLP